MTLCGWRDVKIQELRRSGGHSKCQLWTWHKHDRLLVNSQCSEHCRHWRVQTENDPLNSTHPERYRHWTLQTLNPTDNWILDWTLLTLNNSRQTMNAIDCNPANTEDRWLCMLQLYPIDWTLKKLNWCYRLWTLLALNAIELSRRYRLMLNTVHWNLLTQTVLNWLYTEHYRIIQKAQTALNATHNLIHTTKHLKSQDYIPHHTAISGHFAPYALLHHTVLHPFTFCSPPRPQTFHIIQHAIPHHTL